MRFITERIVEPRLDSTASVSVSPWIHWYQSCSTTFFTPAGGAPGGPVFMSTRRLIRSGWRSA